VRGVPGNWYPYRDPKSQNWILMLAPFLAVPAMRSPITVPRNQFRDDRETLPRLNEAARA